MTTPSLYGRWDEPAVFKPERWLGERTHAAWQFLPFSNGPRNCIGQRFALQEAKLILGLMMRRFELGHVPHDLVRGLPCISPRTPPASPPHLPRISPHLPRISTGARDGHHPAA